MACQCKTNQRGFVLLGYGWQRRKRREGFDHYLVRRCLDCHSLAVEEIHWVRAKVPFCLVCFTQNLMQVAQDDGSFVTQCKTCGAQQDEHMMVEQVKR